MDLGLGWLWIFLDTVATWEIFNGVFMNSGALRVNVTLSGIYDGLKEEEKTEMFPTCPIHVTIGTTCNLAPSYLGSLGGWDNTGFVDGMKNNGVCEILLMISDRFAFAAKSLRLEQDTSLNFNCISLYATTMTDSECHYIQSGFEKCVCLCDFPVTKKVYHKRQSATLVETIGWPWRVVAWSSPFDPLAFWTLFGEGTARDWKNARICSEWREIHKCGATTY